MYDKAGNDMNNIYENTLFLSRYSESFDMIYWENMDAFSSLFSLALFRVSFTPECYE